MPARSNPSRFEDSKADSIREFLFSGAARKYLPALERTAEVIDGFESPLGMELLGTVDWLLNREKCAATVPALREGLTHWPGGRDAAQRKQKLFTDEWLALALNRLSQLNVFAAAVPQSRLTALGIVRPKKNARRGFCFKGYQKMRAGKCFKSIHQSQRTRSEAARGGMSASPKGRRLAGKSSTV